MRSPVAVALLALPLCSGLAFAQAASALQNAAPAASPAAQSGAPVFRAQARTVVVDVVVTGPNGKPVTGLTKNDFSVLENKKPQTVAFFEPHAAAETTAAAPAQTLPPMPPGVFTNYPVAPPRDAINVLLLDALNTPIKDQMYVRQQMIAYLKKLPPGARIAIFTLASRLRIVQGFTSDSSALLAVLDGKKKQAMPQQSILLNSADQMDTLSSMGGQTAMAQSAMQQFNSDTESFQQDLRVRITLQALEEIGRYLSAVPGRKNLIWFSGSFPLNIDADPDAASPFEAMRSYGEEVQQAADMLSVGQIAIYPIDARGLEAPPMYSASNRGSQYVNNPAAFGKHLMKFSSRNAAEHATMQLIADETGGKAIYNTNDLKGALAQVVENGSNYYTLAYTPTDTKWDGQFRHIKILMDKSGYTLQYRQGYYADDPDARRQHATVAPATASQDQFIALTQHGLPDFSQIIYKAHLYPAKMQPPPGAGIASNAGIAGNAKTLKPPLTRYVVDYAAMTRGIPFMQTPDGLRHGALRFAVVAFDRDGKVVNAVSEDVQLNLKPQTYDLYSQVGLQYSQQIDLPPGPLFLRTAIYDIATGRIGTYELPVNVTAAGVTAPGVTAPNPDQKAAK
jgi:VWFA-related protein